MTKHIAIFLICIIFSIITSSCTNESYINATLDKVIDGDTLIVKMTDGTLVELDLYGIDAPELDQPFGESAKKTIESASTKLSKDGILKLKFVGDPIEKKVILYTNFEVNQLQINSGLAWADKENYHDYVTGQNIAQANCRGMWKNSSSCTGMTANNEPIEPWVWRENKAR